MTRSEIPTRQSANPNLAKLQPYPFEKLRLLLKGIALEARYGAINLGIGEPKHPTPEFIPRALAENISGFADYPATADTPALREAIAARAWGRYKSLPKTGFVAGDGELIRAFLLCRTYDGSAMDLPVQVASVEPWDEETHWRKTAGRWKIRPVMRDYRQTRGSKTRATTGISDLLRGGWQDHPRGTLAWAV